MSECLPYRFEHQVTSYVGMSAYRFEHRAIDAGQCLRWNVHVTVMNTRQMMLVSSYVGMSTLPF